jgi:DNA-binding NarL/FixJ family response regulator
LGTGQVSTENAENDVFRVLIADDVQDLRSMLRLALELSGRFTVVAEAMNGAHAVDLATMYKPDLALLDLSMPTLDGLEALPRILEVSPETKVVVLSGFEEARMAPVALKGGATAYIEKGVPPRRLVQALIEIMQPFTGDSDVA